MTFLSIRKKSRWFKAKNVVKWDFFEELLNTVIETRKCPITNFFHRFWLFGRISNKGRKIRNIFMQKKSNCGFISNRNWPRNVSYKISEILTEGFYSCSSPFSFFGTLPLKVMSMRPAFKFDSLVDVFGYLLSLNDRCSAIQFFFYFTSSYSTIGCTICVLLKVKKHK